MSRAKAVCGGMPELLERLYLTCGRSDQLNRLQDTLILPDRYPVFLDYDYQIFFNENQGVCQAGVHKKDLMQPAPPVYVGYDTAQWLKAADTLSEFLLAMFGYQASICLDFSPETFFWVTEAEKKRIDILLPQRPETLANWITCDISLYGDEHYRVALMDTSGEYQLNYAANTKSDFAAVQAIFEGYWRGHVIQQRQFATCRLALSSDQSGGPYPAGEHE